MTISPVTATARAVGHRMHAKSASLLVSLEGGLPRIMTWWFVAAILASALRIAVSPLHGAPGLDTYLPYLLLVTAPLARRVVASEIDREARKGKPVPSDHTPLVIDLDEPGHPFDAGWADAEQRIARRLR